MPVPIPQPIVIHEDRLTVSGAIALAMYITTGIAISSTDQTSIDVPKDVANNGDNSDDDYELQDDPTIFTIKDDQMHKRLKNWTSKIPLTSKKARGIKDICLNQMKITEIDSHFPKHYKHIEEIDLTANKISTIQNLPRGITSLGLNLNRITHLPNLQNFDKLVSISLAYNGLTSIPQGVWPSALRVLDLSNNKLSRIKETAHFPLQLHALDLSGNPLSLLPSYRNIINQIIPNLSVLDSLACTEADRYHSPSPLPFSEQISMKFTIRSISGLQKLSTKAENAPAPPDFPEIHLPPASKVYTLRVTLLGETFTSSPIEATDSNPNSIALPIQFEHRLCLDGDVPELVDQLNKDGIMVNLCTSTICHVPLAAPVCLVSDRKMSIMSKDKIPTKSASKPPSPSRAASPNRSALQVGDQEEEWKKWYASEQGDTVIIRSAIIRQLAAGYEGAIDLRYGSMEEQFERGLEGLASDALKEPIPEPIVPIATTEIPAVSKKAPPISKEKESRSGKKTQAVEAEVPQITELPITGKVDIQLKFELNPPEDHSEGGAEDPRKSRSRPMSGVGKPSKE